MVSLQIAFCRLFYIINADFPVRIYPVFIKRQNTVKEVAEFTGQIACL
jgi:hypothetical protein